jgi:hypothetical protein
MEGIETFVHPAWLAGPILKILSLLPRVIDAARQPQSSECSVHSPPRLSFGLLYDLHHGRFRLRRNSGKVFEPQILFFAPSSLL